MNESTPNDSFLKKNETIFRQRSLGVGGKPCVIKDLLYDAIYK